MITRRLFGMLLGAAPFASKVVEPAKAEPWPATPSPLLATQKVINDGHVTERWLADYCIGTDEMLARVDFKVGPLPMPKRALLLSDAQKAALQAEFSVEIEKARQMALANPLGQYNVSMALDYRKHGPCTEQQDWAHT